MPSIRRRGETLQDREALDIINQPESDTTVIVNSATPGVVSPVHDLPADLVNAPVGLDDDLAHALAARPSHRRWPGITAFLGAAVLVSGGFLGGVLTQKHEGPSSTGSGNAASLAAAFGRTRTGTGTTGAGAAGTGTTGAAGTGATGANAGGAATGGGAAGGGSTIGTVKLVDGSTVYVTTTDGSIVKVTTSKATTIKVTKDGTAEDLAPGTAVVVQGTAGADGVVKATTVTQGGGAGGFGGGGFGGGRTRTGTGGTGTGTGGTGTGGTGGAGAPAQGAGN
jgi:hypothetical protein